MELICLVNIVVLIVQHSFAVTGRPVRYMDKRGFEGNGSNAGKKGLA